MTDVGRRALIEREVAPPTTTAPPAARRRLSRSYSILLLGFAGMTLLAVVRAISDANDLTSAGAFNAALQGAIPIGVVALGGLWAERSGVVNIGLEGMMVLGTWCGAFAGYYGGPWQGLIFGVVGGAVGGLVHAIATVWFNVDHIVSGVAINLLGPGVARYLSVIFFGSGEGGGGSTQSPHVKGNFARIDVPFLAGGKLFGWKSPDLLGWLDDKSWFLISDVAGALRGLVGGMSLIVLFGLVLFPLTWWVLWRTSFGLRLRSCGEDPYAAESLGVNVLRMKTIAVIVSGALAGYAGLSLVYLYAGIYSEGQTAGRGFIGLAAMIFGNWRPGGLAVGSSVFGFTDALRFRGEGAADVHALLLAVAIVLAALGAWRIYRRQVVSGALVAAGGVAFFLWWAFSDEVPKEFVPMTPYVTTMLVLAFAAQRLRMPAADGARYRKGGG